VFVSKKSAIYFHCHHAPRNMLGDGGRLRSTRTDTRLLRKIVGKLCEIPVGPKESAPSDPDSSP